jgi:TusA-related sulfurtransferase
VNDDPVLELDCRGLLCPRPIIELARRISEVPVGSVLAVVADDAAAAHDIPAWCRMRGQQYVGSDTAGDGVTRYLVRRTAAGG